MGSTQSESETKDQEAVQTTIGEKCTELLSTHQNSGEHNLLDHTSLAIPVKTAASNSATRDSVEQCNEIDTKLCDSAGVASTSSSCRSSPHNLQENAHNVRTLQQPEILDDESTVDDSQLKVENSDQMTCGEVEISRL